MDCDGKEYKLIVNNIRRIFKYKKDMKFVAHRPPQVDYLPNKIIEGNKLAEEKGIYLYHFFCKRNCKFIFIHNFERIFFTAVKRKMINSFTKILYSFKK
jgi:hypothetical protein